MARVRISEETRRPGLQQGAPAASRRAPALPALVALVLGASLMSGCSAAATTGIGGWFGASTSRKDATTLYSRRDNVEVREKADSSSKAVATLRAGEKVRRIETSGAWAGIEARGGRLKGWVPASLLGSRPAGATPASAAAASAMDPSSADAGVVDSGTTESDEAAGDQSATEDETATEASAATVPAAEAPAAAPARPAKNGTVAPSVFDPY